MLDNFLDDKWKVSDQLESAEIQWKEETDWDSYATPAVPILSRIMTYLDDKQDGANLDQQSE